jgi:hypothetical protein
MLYALVLIPILMSIELLLLVIAGSTASHGLDMPLLGHLTSGRVGRLLSGVLLVAAFTLASTTSA